MKNMSFIKTVQVTVLALGLMGSASVIAAETYSFDKGHTEIRFSWNHVGISTQSARFLDFDGTFVIDKDDPTKSSVDVSFVVDSLMSTVKAFDKDLMSPKFFDAAKFPKATFKSTSIRQISKNAVEVTGDLTIKGITKTVTLDAELLFEGIHPLGKFIPKYKDAKYTGFKATGQVLRSDFGLGAFAPLTSDRIVIEINTELRKN